MLEDAVMTAVRFLFVLLMLFVPSYSVTYAQMMDSITQKQAQDAGSKASDVYKVATSAKKTSESVYTKSTDYLSDLNARYGKVWNVMEEADRDIVGMLFMESSQCIIWGAYAYGCGNEMTEVADGDYTSAIGAMVGEDWQTAWEDYNTAAWMYEQAMEYYIESADWYWEAGGVGSVIDSILSLYE
jgi:hypothetical protein